MLAVITVVLSGPGMLPTAWRAESSGSLLPLPTHKCLVWLRRNHSSRSHLCGPLYHGAYGRPSKVSADTSVQVHRTVSVGTAEVEVSY